MFIYFFHIAATIDYDRMQAAMENFDAAGNEWKRFEYWDYDKRYTRNLIATDDETFSLMLLCWNPDNESPIHAHAGSECYVRTIQGEVEETLYHWPEKGHEDEPLKVKGVISAKAGEVCHLNDTMGVHKVANPSKSKGAITLHCYIPPYDACKCFFDNNGKPTVSTSSFDTEHGEKISERRSSNLSSLTG